jgi:hypothetical protein
MVTQKEAVDGYVQTQTDIESIKISIQNLEKIIELKLDETKRDIAENRKLIDKHMESCQKNTFEFNKRLIGLEQFSNKVIYLYSGLVFLVGIIVGVWGRGLFQ